MPDNLGLLLNAVICKRLSGNEPVIIATERVPCDWQEYSLLMLPHMDHFMDEKPLQVEVGLSIVVPEQAAFGMEPKIPIRCHGHAFWLKGPPFAIEYLNGLIVDCVAENRSAQIDLRFGKHAS